MRGRVLAPRFPPVLRLLARVPVAQPRSGVEGGR